MPQGKDFFEQTQAKAPFPPFDPLLEEGFSECTLPPNPPTVQKRRGEKRADSEARWMPVELVF